MSPLRQTIPGGTPIPSRQTLQALQTGNGTAQATVVLDPDSNQSFALDLQTTATMGAIFGAGSSA